MVSLRLHQTVQGSLALCLAHAFAAHAMTALPLHEVTGAGVTVGIVDTDFDPANPEFAGRLTKEVYSPPTAATGAGFFGAQGSGDTHGTQVAEVLGGHNSGIAPGVRMRAVASGWGPHVYLNAAINDRLYDLGIRIFNQSNSVGFIDTATAGAAHTYYERYAPFVAKDSLFIWTTGNSGKEQPSMTAGLPVRYPELQRGWLAVTAINAVGGVNGFSADDTIAGAISSYANRCGVAGNWCLAAAGDFVSPSSGEREFGTSYAVPLVSGTAALLQQVYPWMNADLLRQTILSSARRRRDVDTYGWGILHPARALRGPTLFAQELALGPDVHVRFDGMVSTFANAIGGDAGLVKEGSGTLILPAANTYSGRSRIVNGSLHVTGSVAAGVRIERGGELAGAGGHIGGSVVNEGHLRNDGQGLTIAGNYMAIGNAVLSSDLQMPLKIGGSAALGRSHLVLLRPAVAADVTSYVTAPGWQLPRRVLQAGRLHGGFSSIGFGRAGVALPPLLAARLTYAADGVDLHLQRVAVTTAARALGADASRISSAANLERLMLAADAAASVNPGTNPGTSSGVNNALLDSALSLQRLDSPAALGMALDSLSGQIHASVQALGFQQSQTINRALSARMARADNERSPPTAGWWASTDGSRGKLAHSGYASATTSTAGRQFGFDRRFAAGALIGVAVSHAQGHASFDRLGGNASVRHLGFSLYARSRWPGAEDVAHGAYIAARIGAGRVLSTINRIAIAGADKSYLHSTRKDRLLTAYVESGRLSGAAIRISPFAALVYAHLRRGAFQEQGGSFGLFSDSQTYRRLSTLLGVRAAFDPAWPGRLRMQVDAGWQHAHSDGRLDVQATFAAAPSLQFNVRGIALPRNSGWTSAGISAAINRRWHWFARYGKQFSGSLHQHMASLGLRIVWD